MALTEQQPEQLRRRGRRRPVVAVAAVMAVVVADGAVTVVAVDSSCRPGDLNFYIHHCAQTTCVDTDS